MAFPVKRFFSHDLWEMDTRKFPKYLRMAIDVLRVITLAVRGFIEDKCQLRASALTFYSLLSVVPVIAMAFGVAKGFGLETRLKEQIIENSKNAPQTEVIQWLVNFAESMLQATKGGVVAGVGVVVLLWSVMSILGNIESSFNDIWEVKKSRGFLRKFTDYISIMILGPVLLVLSSSITVFISTQVDTLASSVEIISFFDRVFDFFLDLAPYVIIWLIFVLLYVIMPNTKVGWKAAITGGIIAGTFFQVFEWAYINFQIGVARYNAIYGSFAALPLFLIWLQTSWNLVLLGCEISFASQNFHRFAFEKSINNLSIRYRKVIGLIVLKRISQDFEEGRLRTAEQYADQQEMPQRLFNKIATELIESGLLVHADDDKVDGFHPAKDVNKLTVAGYVEILEERGENRFPGLSLKEEKIIRELLKSFNESIDKLPGNKLVKDI